MAYASPLKYDLPHARAALYAPTVAWASISTTSCTGLAAPIRQALPARWPGVRRASAGPS